MGQNEIARYVSVHKKQIATDMSGNPLYIRNTEFAVFQNAILFSAFAVVVTKAPEISGLPIHGVLKKNQGNFPSCLLSSSRGSGLPAQVAQASVLGFECTRASEIVVACDCERIQCDVTRLTYAIVVLFCSELPGDKGGLYNLLYSS